MHLGQFLKEDDCFAFSSLLQSIRGVILRGTHMSTDHFYMILSKSKLSSSFDSVDMKINTSQHRNNQTRSNSNIPLFVFVVVLGRRSKYKTSTAPVNQNKQNYVKIENTTTCYSENMRTYKILGIFLWHVSAEEHFLRCPMTKENRNA